MASAAGKEPYGEMSVYCGTKFGVRGFTKVLAQEHPRLLVCSVNMDQVATHLSGYQGRPPEDVAEVIFDVASGDIDCGTERDADVWELVD